MIIEHWHQTVMQKSMINLELQLRIGKMANQSELLEITNFQNTQSMHQFLEIGNKNYNEIKLMYTFKYIYICV